LAWRHANPKIPARFRASEDSRMLKNLFACLLFVVELQPEGEWIKVDRDAPTRIALSHP